jgi:hypothetical protein
VDVAEGVTGDGVKVGVLVTVSLGSGVIDGAIEGMDFTVAAVPAGAQAFKRRITTTRNVFFIVRLIADR